MGRLTNFFRLRPEKEEELKKEKKVIKKVEKKVIKDHWPGDSEKFIGLGVLPFTDTGERADAKTSQYVKAYTEWVYANVRIIAQGCSQINFELYRHKKDDDVERIYGHEVLELLGRPNSFMTQREFIEWFWTAMLLTGESPWWVVRKNKNNPKEKPSELIPLRPEYLIVHAGDLEEGEHIAKYEYEVPGQKKIEFAPWELFHPMNLNPNDPYRGYSYIKAAAVTIETDLAASEYNRNFFWNSAMPNAILTTSQRLQDDTYQRLLKTWNNKFKGSKNAHKLAILESGLEYKPIQLSQSDMQFLEQQKWTRDKIMGIFGNTPVMLGIVEDVNRANAESSEFVWLKHNIKPKMQMMVDFFNEFLLPLYADDIFLSFTDPIPTDKKVLAEELKSLTNVVYTYNEARALKGLEAVEGGDILYHPINLSPITGVNIDEAKIEIPKSYIPLKAKGNSNIGKKDFSREIQKLKNRNYTLNKKAEKLSKEVEDMFRAIFSKGKKEESKKIVEKQEQKLVFNQKGYPYKVKEAFWKSLIKNSDKFEDRFIDTLNIEIYSKVEREVLLNIETHIAKSYKKKAINPFDKDKIIEVSFANFLPLVQEIFQVSGEEAIRFLDLDAQFLTTEKIRETLIQNTKKLADSITDTMAERLANTLSEGLKNGEGQVQLVKRAKDVMGDLKKKQAKMIAVTEVSRATNIGVLEAYRQSGIERKQWFTALDERVCPYCDSMEGKILGTSKNYFDKGDTLNVEQDGKEISMSLDYEDIMGPPLHVSCRCTTVPYFGESSQNIMITKKSEDMNLDDIVQDISEKAKREIEKSKEILVEEVINIADEKIKEKISKFDETLNKIDEALDGQREDRRDTKED